MLIKRTKERSQEITPDNRGVIWGKELNGMATDEELYGQYLSGDETGLELLIKKYGDPLTLYIDGYLHDVHEAEDLMMETFSWLFTKKPRIRNGCFKAYLYKAARHMALRHKSRRRIIFSLDDLTREPEAQTLVEEVIRTKERKQILHLLNELQEKYEMTYLLITHDLSNVPYLCKEVAIMYQGRVVEFIDHTDSLKETAVHPYTKDLFDSIPVKEPKMRRIGLQEKKIFSDTIPEQGCPYQNRCRRCTNICREHIPELTEIETGHFAACHML